MGASFYHAMGFLDLVAGSADQYVDIAVRLGTDRLYRHKCATVIKHLSPVIWEREEVTGGGDGRVRCGTDAAPVLLGSRAMALLESSLSAPVHAWLSTVTACACCH